MSLTIDDTIAAIASPPGPALRGVIRISGLSTFEVVSRCFSPDDADGWSHIERPSRFPGRIPLDDYPRGLPCDVLLWPKSSYTGQPAAEVHLVGAPPLVEAVLESIHAAGGRPANRGEFTLRAFLAGRLDLTQAEAVLGVIDADDADELATALEQLDGGLAGPLGELHERLLIDLADLEAGLDFVDEDIDFVSRDDFDQRLRNAVEEIDNLLSSQSDRGRARSSLSVVLTGPPNAGKSTLLNALAGRESAIVSDIAGTTRDVIEETIDVRGRPVRFLDTAGIDEGSDPLVIAAEHLRRSAAEDASLVLFCNPAGHAVDTTELARLRSRVPVLSVATKADLVSDEARVTNDSLPVSATTGIGLEALLDRVATLFEQDSSERSHLVATTSARCRGSLAAARDRLQQARQTLAVGLGDELVAEELRRGLDELAGVLGKVYTDDILDRVFSRFCIGK